jgi:signal transduction histidine kinase
VNLVQNAVRFTPEGQVTIDARVDAVEPHRAVLELTVTDTGVGLDATQRGHLFQPFTGPPGEPVHGSRGTGLGLTITQRLLAAMGGTIAVEPGPGRGSRFVARLPVERSGASLPR